MSLFLYSNYREILASKISENRKQKGYRALVSAAMRSHSSHLSHILAGTNQLTPDQGAALSDFWQLDEHETDYFLTLIERERAGTETLQKKLDARLDEIRHRRTSLPRLPVDFSSISVESSLRFFSKWYLPVIHSALEISGLRTVPELAANLQLTEALVETSLKWLEERQMVRREGGDWTPVSFGLTTDSREFQALYHQEIRKRAAEHLGQGESDSVHYTMLCAVSPDDYVEFRNKVRSLIKAMEEKALASAKQELVAICIDLFKITRE